MKRVVACFVVLFLSLATYLSYIPISHSKDLSFHVRTDPENLVISDSYLNLFCFANLNAFVNIYAIINNRTIQIEKNFDLTEGVEKSVRIPVKYPLINDFEIKLIAEDHDGLSKSTFSKRFLLRKRIKGIEKIKGRVFVCSKDQQIGLEDAKVEIISGPTVGSTFTEDDGYFTLEDVPSGNYKLGIRHECSSGYVEKIVIVNEYTPMVSVCMSTYGIPDIDLWLNKPSGSSFEIGETVTFHLRSTINTKIDLWISDEITKNPLFLDLQLKENEITDFYWIVPSDSFLGKKSIQLKPKETGFCGSAKYQIFLTGELKKGTIRGRVTVDEKPIQNAEVYLPLQFNDHVFTDDFGYFEIKNVSPGFHVLRCQMDGFEQQDMRGVEVSQGQITKTTPFDLIPNETEFKINPSPLYVSSHERREKITPIEFKLNKGYAKDIVITPFDIPDGMFMSSKHIPSLLQETEILYLTLSEKLIPDTYQIRYKIQCANAEFDLIGTVTVAGLSFGTFDGHVLPRRVTLPQGYKANFTLHTDKFTNFNQPLSYKIAILPPYCEIKYIEEPNPPPFTYHFVIEIGLSTPIGEYPINLEVSGDNQKMVFSSTLEVIKAGGSLVTIPEKGWDPILEPGKSALIPIAIYSPKGISQNVRVNLDFGPSFLKLENRSFGNVGEKKVFCNLAFEPNDFMQPGGYEYSISFTYGERNEGFKKFAGRIHVMKSDPNIPTNVRAKYIEENHKIVLTWGPPAKDEDSIIGYNVYKSLHYPSLDSSFPINNSLVANRFYEDEDFKIGKTYWYAVKAVKNDGTISKKSNTAEIPVLSRDTLYCQLSIDKGEKATYFVGEVLKSDFSSSFSGILSMSLKSKYFEAVLEQKQIGSNQANQLSYLIPDFPEDSILTATFTSDSGLNTTIEKMIKIKKSKPGKYSIKGILWNTYTDEPLPFAKISIWEGSTQSIVESDRDGIFQMNGLLEGLYRLLIEKENLKTVLDPIEIQQESVDLKRIPLFVQKDRSFLSWTGNTQSTWKRGSFFPLFYKSYKDTFISVSIKHKGIERMIIARKRTTGDRVYLENITIPEDIPPGNSFILVRDLEYKNIFSHRISVEDFQEGIWGRIIDIYKNPLCDVSIFDSKTNEWGYFSLKSKSDFLEIHKDKFIDQKIPLSEFTNEQDITLLMKTGDFFALQNEVSIAEDFNDFSFDFISKNGSTSHFQLTLDSDSNQFESIILDLFPGYIYRFSYDSLLAEQVNENSSITLSSDLSTKTIGIKKGPTDKIYGEMDPIHLVLENGIEKDIPFDLYSFGTYKKNFSLSAESENPSLTASFEPEKVVPGNSSLIKFKTSPTIEPGNYLFLVQLKNDQITLHISLVVTITDRLNSLLDPEWNPVIYENSEDTFEFFFSKKSISLFHETLPEGFNLIRKEQSVILQYSSKIPGKTQYQFNLTLDDKQELIISVQLEVIAKETWISPKISALSKKEGILLTVEKNGYDQHFFVNKAKTKEYIHFISDMMISDAEFLDRNVKENQKYVYSIFSTNGRLEASWSNWQEIVYRQLFLNVNLKGDTLTNQTRFPIKGSISIGTELTINEKLVIVEKNGTFSSFYSLKEGKNLLSFLVKDFSGNELKQVFTIFLDTIPPKITLMDPNEQDIKTTDASGLIRFLVNEVSYVSINGNRIVPKSNDLYELIFPLKSGNNLLEIKAIDPAGNQSQINLIFRLYKSITTLVLKIGLKSAKVNNKLISLDVPPQIIQGRTLVPLRFIADGFGAEVDWKADTKEITIQLDTHKIKMQIGNRFATNEQKQTIVLDVPPQIIQGRTLVPLRFIADGFGAEVDWKADAKEIYITYTKK